MILFLYGKDNYRSRQQLHKMVAKFKADRDPQGLNTIFVDMAKQDIGVLLEKIMAIPFLSEKKMVIIENLLVSKNKEAQKEILKKLEEKSFPKDTIILFYEGVDQVKTKDAKNLFTRLTQEKYAQHFEELIGYKLEAWIAHIFKEQQVSATKPAISLLAKSCQHNMWGLSNILEQVICFADKKEVGIKQVKPFITEHADDNIFNLVDAIISKQSKPIYKMLQEQYVIGKDASYIIAMLIRQFKILIQMRDLFEREEQLSSAVMAKRMGVHPFVAKKSLVLIKKTNLKSLKKSYSELLHIDEQIKTGQQDQKLLLDLFVAKFQLSR